MPHPSIKPIPYVAKHRSSKSLVLWVDVETTGPDPATALPLELAACVTRVDGTIITEVKHWAWIYPRSWRGELERETAMHAAWIDSILSDTTTRPCVPNVEGGLFELWRDAHHVAEIEEGDRLPLGGKNVHYDRAVLLRVAPIFTASLLSYRNVDTKILSMIGVPEIPATPGFPAVEPAHRAKADVLSAISQYGRAREILRQKEASRG